MRRYGGVACGVLGRSGIPRIVPTTWEQAPGWPEIGDATGVRAACTRRTPPCSRWPRRRVPQRPPRPRQAAGEACVRRTVDDAYVIIDAYHAPVTPPIPQYAPMIPTRSPRPSTGMVGFTRKGRRLADSSLQARLDGSPGESDRGRALHAVPGHHRGDRRATIPDPRARR
jgi:hypothetical protein